MLTSWLTMRSDKIKMNPYVIPYNKLLLWIEDLLNVKAKACGIKRNTGVPFLLLCRKPK